MEGRLVEMRRDLAKNSLIKVNAILHSNTLLELSISDFQKSEDATVVDVSKRRRQRDRTISAEITIYSASSDLPT